MLPKATSHLTPLRPSHFTPPPAFQRLLQLEEELAYRKHQQGGGGGGCCFIDETIAAVAAYRSSYNVHDAPAASSLAYTTAPFSRWPSSSPCNLSCSSGTNPPHQPSSHHHPPIDASTVAARARLLSVAAAQLAAPSPSPPSSGPPPSQPSVKEEERGTTETPTQATTDGRLTLQHRCAQCKLSKVSLIVPPSGPIYR